MGRKWTQRRERRKVVLGICSLIECALARAIQLNTGCGYVSKSNTFVNVVDDSSIASTSVGRSTARSYPSMVFLSVREYNVAEGYIHMHKSPNHLSRFVEN